MPRFVVLLHETPPGFSRATHLDLMLERGECLWTWAIPELPSSTKSVEGERLADHRLAYLEFEGEIAGGRGRVRPVDAGDFDLISAGPAEVVAEMRGDRLRGRLTIERVAPEDQRWRVSLDSGGATPGSD